MLFRSGSDRERSPLEPVKDNILPVAGEPPPLELPDPLKGAQAIDDVPEELMQEADPESGDSAETLPSLASSSSSAGTSAGPVLAASDEALLHVQRSQPLAMPMKRDSTGMPTERPEFGLSSSAPAFASSAPAFAFSLPRPASLTVSRNEDDGAASAIQALLALQRDDSPGRAPVPRSWSTLSDGEAPLGRVLSDSRLDVCPPSPALSAKSMDDRPAWPTPLGGGSSRPSKDGAARFYCRFPKCGKGYASTDAVRKHCRQRHLEWLRRLGHGCPALYCRWSADVLDNVLAGQDEDALASPK